MFNKSVFPRKRDLQLIFNSPIVLQGSVAFTSNRININAPPVFKVRV